MSKPKQGMDWVDQAPGDFTETRPDRPSQQLIAVGGDAKDFISGGDKDDHLTGGGGDDLVMAGIGNDLVIGDGDDINANTGGNDWLFGQEGNDTLHGGGGNDWLDAGTGNDLLFGGHGRDFLDGGEGNDHVTGGQGVDTMHGGAGKDTFYFNSAADSPDKAGQRDLIADFEQGQDKISMPEFELMNAGKLRVVEYDPKHKLELGEITSHFDAKSGNTIVEVGMDNKAGGDLGFELIGDIKLTANDFTFVNP